MKDKIDLSSIKVERVIVHDLPKHKLGDLTTKPNYSQQESTLTNPLRAFFKDKIVSALSSDRAFKICFNEEEVSPVPMLILGLMKNRISDFVASTQDIAKHLFDNQDGKNAPGILLIIIGKVNGFNSCIVVKLERDKGAQLTLDQKTQAYNIKEIQDLMLTEKTKVFKVALFVMRDDHTVHYDGITMDYQINVKQKKSEILSYFIDRFLGCVAFEDPKITTQKFYNLTRTFIDNVDDPILLAKYVQDLNSYIQKNTKTLNPSEFADEYLKGKHKDKYRTFLESENFDLGSFPKDTNLIDARIAKISITFINDITIVGNKGILEKHVKLTPLSDGNHKAEIISKIKKVV